MLFRGAGTGAYACRLRLRGGERQIPFPSSRKDKYFRQKKIRAFAFFYTADEPAYLAACRPVSYR